MARNEMTHRAIAAGIGGAVALAVPAVASIAIRPAAAGIPFADGGFAPFTVGALTGVAVTGVVSYFAMRAQERDYELDGFGQNAAEKDVPLAHGAREGGFEGELDGGAAGAGSVGRMNRRESHGRTGLGGRFRRHAEEGVPVIARAEGALSEEEAWAEIDAALSENASIGCDPASSKDIYEIAFEELARARRAPAEGMASAAGRAGEGASAPAVARAVADAEFAEPVSMETQSVGEVLSARIPGFAEEQEPEVEQRDYTGHEDMWAAALAVLMDEKPAEADAATSHETGSAEDTSVFMAAALGTAQGGMQDASAIVDAAGGAGAAGAADDAPTDPVMSVASATDAFAAPSAGVSPQETAAFVAAAQAYAPVAPGFVSAADAPGFMYVPAYAVPVAYAVPSQGHARARSLEVNERVNEILEEEFSKNNSQSVRATSRRYLRVVNGGTAAWQRLETKQA